MTTRLRAWLTCGAVAVTSTAAGCRALVELVETDEAAQAGVDADVRDPDARIPNPACDRWTFAPRYVDPCDLPVPTGELVLGDGVWTYDTNSGALTDPDQDATFPASALLTPVGSAQLRVISADVITIAAGATLRVSGSRPLLLVSWSSVTIDGTLDASSRAGASAAGADPDACAATAAVPGTEDLEGGGGGGGGGFGTAGADGGTGNDGLATGGTGGGGPGAAGVLRGGCAGAVGGNPLAGLGGPGGGAVHVLALGTATISGTITAGGAGGLGSQGGRSGGGGGGSGGHAGVEAAAVNILAGAIIAANGGGGGGGSDNGVALPGQDGTASAVAASAGGGQGMGIGGGAGAARDTGPGPGGNARRGGGGGGGGVGVVVLLGAVLDVDGAAVISPTATPP